MPSLHAIHGDITAQSVDAIAVAIETIGSFAGNVGEARLVAFDAETYARIAARISG